MFCKLLLFIKCAKNIKSYNGQNFISDFYMLSYRHAFHAGNHADVLKHYVLSLVLAHTAKKDKPFWYIDTHAGAGMYSLDTGYATQNAEFEQGISKLIATSDLPSPLADFVAHIQSFNTPSLNTQPLNMSTPTLYPGSPTIAEKYCRADDKMRLFELHPNDFKLLSANFSGMGKQVKVELQNGFDGIKACLPPPSRRAVVLIDPPYEDKQDYQHVVDAMEGSLKRFATGTYIIWHPMLQRPEPGEMIESLMRLNVVDWLHVSLSIHAPSAEGYGMHGSGLFIINPPWTLSNTLRDTLPALVKILALDETASFSLDSQIS